MILLKILFKLMILFILVVIGLVVEAAALTYLPLWWAAAVFIPTALLVGWGIHIVTEWNE